MLRHLNCGGMPDMIDHQINGYLANPFDTSELGRGLKNSLDYRFYDFVDFFKKRSLKLQQITLKIGVMTYCQSVF